MKNLLRISLLLIFLISQTISWASTPQIDEDLLCEAIKDVEIALAQFQEVLAYNQRNIEEGTPEKNIYFYNYRSGQTINYDSNGDLVFIYNKIDDTDPTYIHEPTRADLNTKMVAFNNDPENVEKVKLYAFYINSVKLAIVSDYFNELGNSNTQNVLAHLESKMNEAKNTSKAEFYKKNYDEYKGFIDTLDNRIKYTFNFGGNENNILFWGIRYRAAYNKKAYLVRKSTGIKTVGLHIKENELGLKLYTKEMKEKRTYEEYEGKTAQYYKNNILSSIEYFGDPALISKYDKPCIEQLEYWKDHPMLTDPNHPYFNIIQQNPCALNNMTTDAFNPANIDGLEEVDECKYELSEAALIARTEGKKIEAKQAAIDLFAEKLTTLIGDDKKFVYSENLSANQKLSLNDKFAAYKKYTGKQVFVVNLPLQFYLEKSEYQTFADEVANKASGFSASEMLFVCVPYYEGLVFDDLTGNCSLTQGDRTGLSKKFYLFQKAVGLHADKIGGVSYESNVVSAVGSYFDANFFPYCINFYKEIPKPHLPVNYYLFADGDIITPINTKEIPDDWKETQITGYTSIVDFNILYDQKIDDLNDALNGIKLGAGGESYLGGLERLRLEQKIEQIKLSAKSGTINWKVFEAHRLKELTALDNFNDTTTNHWAYAQNILPEIYTDEFFIEKKNYDLSEEVLFPVDWSNEIFIALDVTSVVLAPFKLDLLPEMVGLCYAVYKKDLLNTTIFAGSLVGIGVPSALMEPTILGQGNYIVKIGGGGTSVFAKVGTDEFPQAVSEILGISDNLAAQFRNSNELLQFIRNKRIMDIRKAHPGIFSESFFQLCKDDPNFLKNILGNGTLLNEYVAIAAKVPTVLDDIGGSNFFRLLDHFKNKAGFKDLFVAGNSAEAKTLLDTWKQVQGNLSLGSQVNKLNDNFITFLNDVKDLGKFDIFAGNPQRVKAWEVLEGLPEIRGNEAFLDRMLDDLADHTDFDVFFKQGDNAEKWTVVNSAAINADSKGISEWLEDITFNQTIETRFASGNPNKVEFFYDNQKIATADKDGTIETFDNGVMEGDFGAEDIIVPQSGGGDRGLVCVTRNGKTSCGIQGGACFVTGTLISTPTGKKRIENIQIGDKVISYNINKQKLTISNVKQTFKRGITQIYQIVIGKDKIETTAEHPFYTLDGWKPANQLKKGMKVLTLASASLAIDTIFTYDSIATVYNFEVEKQHNYFVGNSGFLVHNSYDLTEWDLEEIYDNLTDKSRNRYLANSPEHKAIAWQEWNDRPNAGWSYERWSNNYHSNMKNANQGNQAVKDYKNNLDWGDGYSPETEVVVSTPLGDRRIDVADAIERRGAEVKSYETGKVYNTSFIESEWRRDASLVDENGWQMDWVFINCEPSGPLKTALENAGINIILE